MVSHLLQLAPVVAYAGLGALVAGESAGIPLPGETSLIAAAVLAAQGRLSLPLVVGIAAGAAILGDNVGYLIGRRGVRSLLLHGGPFAERRRILLARGEAFFTRRGRAAVFLGRWVPWLRITVAWLAGAGRMRWRTFAVWNALGGVAWATSIGVAVYLLGAAGRRDASRVGLVLLAAGAITIVVPIVLRHFRRRARTE
jgi:membrane-associated protein